MASSGAGDFVAGDMLYGSPNLGTDPAESASGGAQHALDTILQRADDTGLFVTVPNLNRINPVLDRDALDITLMENVDAWRRMVAGNQGMALAIEGDWDGNDVTLAGILTDSITGTRRLYKLFFPNDTRWSFVVHTINDFAIDAPQAETLTFTAGLQIHSEPVFT